MKHDYKWLESYTSVLEDKHVLELGCGSGIDTAFISSLTEHLISGDLAPELNSAGIVVALDHSKILPFKNEVFDTVVASLCLHYFSLQNTKEIITEIARVLKPKGTLICRLNSYKDKNHGAVGNPVIEPGFYNVNGEHKRFFTKQQIKNLWEHEYLLGEVLHKSIDRYQKTKYVYEFSATKV